MRRGASPPSPGHLLSSALLTILATRTATPDSTTCPYDLATASLLIPPTCYANNTDTASTSPNSCCTSVFAAYIYAAIRYSNQSGNAFLPNTTASACSDAFTSYLIRSRLVRPSFILTGDRCNLNGDPTMLSAGKRACQYPTVAGISSSVNLSAGIRLCTAVDLMSDQATCTACQNSVVAITLTLLNVTKSKEFVPCGMATTIGIWSSVPEIERFRSYAVCMLEILDNVGNLGTSSLLPSPPPPSVGILLTPARKSNNKRNLKIAAGSLSAGILTIVVVLLLFIVVRKRRKSTNPTTIESPIPIDGLYIFTKSELKQATNDFDPKLMLGEGGAGKVYLGKLPSGQHVAIKRIYQKRKIDQFYREIEILGKLRHRNLTTLLGYCQQKKEHVLVSEYMAGGNLSRALYHGELTWHQRLKIAVDIAEGLLYLHEFPEGVVIHRDVKPTNILLSDSGHAKLCDFGVSKILPSKLSHVSTEIKGTTGYLDPEYFSVGHVSEAADVYSFGIVLLELITGKKAVFDRPSGGAEFIVYHAHVLMTGADEQGEPEVGKIADRRFGPVVDTGSLGAVFKIAYQCVKPYKHERPSMKEVLGVLKKALSEMEKVFPPVEEATPTTLSTPADMFSVASTTRASTPSVQSWSS